MKKLFPLVITLLLVISFAIPTTALAGASVSISGPSTVVPGQTAEYKITVSGTGFNMMGSVSVGGVFSGSGGSFSDDNNSNGSLSDSCTVSVSVPSSAKVGSTGTISVSGSGQALDADYNPLPEFGISGSKTATVVAASTPKPASNSSSSSSSSSSTPKPTVSIEPTPTPEPTTWELLESSISSIDEGATKKVTLTKEDGTKLSTNVLTELKNKKGILVLKFPDYTCTIDGTTLGTIDGERDSIDVSMLVGDKADPNISLVFTHDSDFPGVFSYTFKTDAIKADQSVYLYRYFALPNTYEGVLSTNAESDGSVTLDVYYGGSYQITTSVLSEGVYFTDQEEETSVPVQEQNIDLIIAIIGAVALAGIAVVVTILVMNSIGKPKKGPKLGTNSNEIDNNENPKE